MPINFENSLPFDLPSYATLRGSQANGRVLVVHDHYYEQAMSGDLANTNSASNWYQRRNATGEFTEYANMGGWCQHLPQQQTPAPRGGDFRRNNIIDTLRDMEKIRADVVVVNLADPRNSDAWATEHLTEYFAAAQSLITSDGLHVRIAPALDLASLAIQSDPDDTEQAAIDVAGALAGFKNNPAWYKVTVGTTARYFLSCTAAENRSRAFWIALRTAFQVRNDMPMYFAPKWVGDSFWRKSKFHKGTHKKLPPLPDEAWPNVPASQAVNAENLTDLMDALGKFGPLTIDATTGLLSGFAEEAHAASKPFLYPIGKDDVRPKNVVVDGPSRVDPINTKLLRAMFADADAANAEFGYVITLNDNGEGTDIWRSDRAGWSWLALVAWYGCIFRGITPKITRNVAFVHHRPHTAAAVPMAEDAVLASAWNVEGSASPIEQLEVLMFPTGDCTIEMMQGTISVKRSVVGNFPAAFGVDLKPNNTPRIVVRRAGQTFLDFTVAPVATDSPEYLSYMPYVDMSSVREDEAGPVDSQLPQEEDVMPITLTGVPADTEYLVYTRSDPADDAAAIIVRVHTSTGQSTTGTAERLRGEMYVWSNITSFANSTFNVSEGASYSVASPNIADNKVSFRLDSGAGRIYVKHKVENTQMDLRIWIQRVSF